MSSMESEARLLDGKIAVVTGGAQGIGAAIARRFAQHGASVVVADIDREAALDTAAQIGQSTGNRVLGDQLDVSDEAQTESAFERWMTEFGRIDAVVANAGILHLAPAVEIPITTWRRVLDVNLTGGFLTARTAAKHMIALGNGGSIVLTSSLFGIRGGRENAAYSASKFGLIGLGQCLAAEVAPHKVRVNSVCPGQVQTDMIRQLLAERAVLTGRTTDEILHELVGRVPMGRMGTTEEVADVCIFLASPLSAYITGQSIVIDGGWQVG
jgi:NAD(P)-dependent dehydrogenase (short-subunit alcohol dehydrogenase family)